MTITSAESKTRNILIFIVFTQGAFVLWSFLSNPAGFFKLLGFAEGLSGSAVAWLLAAAVATAYVGSAATISFVRVHLIRWSTLKALSIAAALAAGILEEVIFRKWLMDFLNNAPFGFIVQILASGFAFGLAHIIWGAKNFRAGINAVLSTSVLGAALAVVYLIGNRSLAPCVVAHFIITALIEPGLILAAMNDKLGYLRESAQPIIPPDAAR
jgi:membrane protease YdiL (CAAX protease family)